MKKPGYQKEFLKNFPCMIFIYGNKVAIYTVKEDLIGIIIKNKEFSEAMRLIFNLYWAKGTPAKL